MTSPLLHLLALAGPRQACRYCAAATESGALCSRCEQALQDLRQRCFQCALPLTDSAGICGECLANPPCFDRTVCGDSYQPPFSHWLQNFKDFRDLRDGHLLTRRLIQQLERAYPSTDGRPQALIPVPLHWRKALWRNFNQSCWMARQLGRHFNIPVIQALHRTQPGDDQRHLSRQERQRNLRGVFRLHPRCQRASIWPSLHNKHVALIDDVITTTATARAISRELRHQGIGRVDIWSLARTDKTHLHY
ncbi:ComF family protein [Aestuariicella hydrocarbonica]|uniref:ComF family protein n=1 Tax=Pseudomaricurvus hydrocarbonicus TaxID=1470433 RepID=A0A9E5MMJ8_9GAMM|nr:ComF family protein [Aestuariicella hydrocarbonica]NHO66999.1 ComF family protein [Aestuariicella hydrocarbonica]